MANKNWIALLKEHNIPLTDAETLEELDFSVEGCYTLPAYVMNDKMGDLLSIRMLSPLPGMDKLDLENFVRINLFYHLPKNEEGYTSRYILEIVKDCQSHYVDMPRDAQENFDRFLEFIVRGS